MTAAHAAFFGLVAVTEPPDHPAELLHPFTARLIELASDESTAEVPPPPPPPEEVPPDLPPVLAVNEPAPTPQAAPLVEAPKPRPRPPAPEKPKASRAARHSDADSVHILHNPKPAYPSASRQLGEHGRVLLRVRVSAGGRVESVAVAHGSGYPRLDQAAMNAVRGWSFTPARRGGEAIASWVLVPITFNIKG
ncbi:MAG: hypothetical protein A2286_00650 [Gammaproteobacteria bacterium RIFOXYA12_FULL_61_12]|nr:MAG: hypothetical protein A2286_00650 [Gammaproteobacteria bacterium RIFOXYA12_FULL_61_12]